MALPPFASFLAELMVIAGGIAASPYTAVTIIVPVLTGGYLLWMIRRVVLGSPEERTTTVPAEGRVGTGADIPRIDAAVLALYIAPLVLLILFSFLILSPAAPVAQWVVHLTGGAGGSKEGMV